MQQINYFRDIDKFISPRRKRFIPFYTLNSAKNGFAFFPWKKPWEYTLSIRRITNSVIMPDTKIPKRYITIDKLKETIKKELRKNWFKEKENELNNILEDKEKLNKLSLDELNTYIDKTDSAFDRHELEKRKRVLRKKEGRKNFLNKSKIGDIFYVSYGYDETHVHFYRIININSSKLTLERLSKIIKEDDNENVYPGTELAGETLEFTLRSCIDEDTIKRDEYTYLYRWDWRGLYETRY